MHAHIGHVMIAWRDTPGQVGLLTIAQSDTRIAAAHALLLSKATSVDDMKLHAGHVLHALDPAIETAGPASGYGAKKAAAGAMQHVGFHRGRRQRVGHGKSHASKVTTTLTDAIAAIDRGIAAAQKIRGASAAPEAPRAARDLQSSVEDIGRGPSAGGAGNAAHDEGEGFKERLKIDMPIYEYECRGCGHQFEFLLLPTNPEAPACPSCKGQDSSASFPCSRSARTGRGSRP